MTAQAADSSMAKDMTLRRAPDIPAARDFLAEPFLKEHPEFEWEKPVLQDMKGNPWAEFKAGEKQ